MGGSRRWVAARAVLAWLVAAVAAACGGGGNDAAVAAATAPTASKSLSTTSSVDRGTLLHDGWAAYPRLVRLAHQSRSALNGRIVASLTENAGGTWQAGFHVSSDDGATFGRLGALVDPGFAKGLCCGTLFELPQAVGALPAGALLYAASVGQDVPGTFMEQPIYISTDAGATFMRLPGATCGRSSVARGTAGQGSGIWEPEFLVTSDGTLACIFSDESEAGRSQVLKLTATSDGVAWSVPTVIVAGAEPGDRPGMAGVRRLPSGRYAMTFEACSTARLDCSARLLLSDDGLSWGEPGGLGTALRTADGRFFRHAPTLAWAASATSGRGRLVLIGQIVSIPGGVDDADNGHVLMVNDAGDATGEWRMVDAPIGLDSAPRTTNWCQNYSTPLLPSLDGTQLLMMQTDSSADGGCRARFGRGPLAS